MAKSVMFEVWRLGVPCEVFVQIAIFIFVYIAVSGLLAE
jgi:hypothetical protein